MPKVAKPSNAGDGAEVDLNRIRASYPDAGHDQADASMIGRTRYILYAKPKIFYNGDFVIWRKELLFEPAYDPPLRIQSPLFEEKPKEIEALYKTQLSALSKSFKKLEKLTEDEKESLRGKTSSEINQYFKKDPRIKIVECNILTEKLKDEIEKELFQYCEKKNRDGVINVRGLLTEHEILMRSMGNIPTIVKTIEYARGVIGEYFDWYSKNNFTFPILIEQRNIVEASGASEVDEEAAKRMTLKSAKGEAYKECQVYFRKHINVKSAPMEICRGVVEKYFHGETDVEKTRLAKAIRTSINSKKIKPSRKRKIRLYNS